MKNRAKAVARTVSERDFANHPVHPLSGSSLVPMLVIGLVLTLAGMMAALALS